MAKSAKYISQAAIIAALYVVLNHMQNALLPGSASWAVQFRAAEALCVLSLFTPAAIPGLSIGCALFNMTSGAGLPLDFLAGSAASFLAAWGMWRLRRHAKAALLLPALTNAVLVGWELSVQMGGGFLVNAAYVAAGEGLVLLTLGSALYTAIKGRKLDKRLFG